MTQENVKSWGYSFAVGNILLPFSILLASAFYAGRFGQTCRQEPAQNSLEVGLATHNVPVYNTPGNTISPDDTILSLEERPFSCNAQMAFEQITRLHKRVSDLALRRERGEANRVRIANLERKYTQAKSAEGAYRACMQSMMPELLEKWDRILKENKVPDSMWTDRSEAKIQGIDLNTLMNTAAALEERTSSLGV